MFSAPARLSSHTSLPTMPGRGPGIVESHDFWPTSPAGTDHGQEPLASPDGQVELADTALLEGCLEQSHGLGDHLIERDVGSLVDVPERVDELIAVIDIEHSQVVVVDLSSHGHVPECESNPRPGTWTAGEASGRGWAGHAGAIPARGFHFAGHPRYRGEPAWDDEANLKFPIECLNAVCELIRPRRRRNVGRVYSAEHLAALAEAGRQTRFPSAV